MFAPQPLGKTAAFPAPFPPEHALDTQKLRKLSPRSTPRTSPDVNTVAIDPDAISYVPGHPWVELSGDSVALFLERELATPILDELYNSLWIFARPSFDNIDPLHRQKVKERKIIPVQSPKLHLVWKNDGMYVKPMPVWMLNHDFWVTFLSSPDKAPLFPSRDRKAHHSATSRSTALGFVRSYAFLVQDELDFKLAQADHLIPPDIRWIQWATFLSYFRNLEDSQVSTRYHFGQLRISRLNWAVRLIRPKSASTWWFYELPYWAISPYLQAALSPFIFVFGSVSVVLSSMQVIAAFESSQDGSQLAAMKTSFRGFSMALVVSSVIVWALIICIPFLVLVHQVSWGVLNRIKM